MPTINLLHVSDLHMAAVAMRDELIRMWRKPKIVYRRLKAKEVMASHNPKVVERLAAFAHKRKDYLNAIVITGDIATTGSADDLAAGYKLLTERPGRFPYLSADEEGTLNLSADLPVFILPGNHDRYSPTKRKHSLVPGGREFHRVFRAWWTEDVKVYQVESGEFVLGVVAADFSLRDIRDAGFPSLWNKWAQGRVYPEILRMLENLTLQFHIDAKAARKKSVAIWAVHYPPHFDYGSRRKTTEHRLNEEAELVEAARRYSVPLILAGHTHTHRFYPDGLVTPAVSCAGTSSQFCSPDAGNYCHIISFDIDDSGYQYAVRNYRFNKIAGDFQHVSDNSS